MKHPMLLLLAFALAVLLWGVAKTSKSSQSPPLEILAVGQPIDCGKFEDHLIFLRKRWEVDKQIMRKGLLSPVFKKDWDELEYYEELFWLIPCSKT